VQPAAVPRRGCTQATSAEMPTAVSVAQKSLTAEMLMKANPSLSHVHLT